VLCAADEVAVNLFLSQRLKFVDIANVVRQVLEEHQVVTHPSLQEIVTADAWARERVAKLTSGDTLC